jgi:hypothetical protein
MQDYLLLKKCGENREEKPMQGGVTERPGLAKRLRHGEISGWPGRAATAFPGDAQKS